MFLPQVFEGIEEKYTNFHRNFHFFKAAEDSCEEVRSRIRGGTLTPLEVTVELQRIDQLRQDVQVGIESMSMPYVCIYMLCTSIDMLLLLSSGAQGAGSGLDPGSHPPPAAARALLPLRARRVPPRSLPRRPPARQHRPAAASSKSHTLGLSVCLSVYLLVFPVTVSHCMTLSRLREYKYRANIKY